MIGRFFAAALFSAAQAAAALPTGDQAQPPLATELWTIASGDCISVHADGEPWDECGFQAFAMNPEASRVLTVSTLGAIQLWDGEGRELRRIDWPDHRSGASGFPSGRALIAGRYAVAVVHQNQLAVLDLAEGTPLSQHVFEDVMLLDELEVLGPDRLLARGKDRDWKLTAREIVLPHGTARAVRWREAGYAWIEGVRAPFRRLPAKPAGAVALKAAWMCKPIDERYCFRRDLPGRQVHMFDLVSGRGLSVDVGRTLGQFDSVHFAVAGGRSWAVVCGRSRDTSPYLRPCETLDMLSERRTYAFDASDLRAEGGFDEQGWPELRLTLSLNFGRRDQRRVALDGTVRTIDPEGRAALMAPGGGMVLPAADPRTSILVGVDGRPVARLPFPAQACGNGWPDWNGWCRYSADGRRLLMPAREEGPEGAARRGGLTLHAIPSGAPAAPRE